MWEEFLRWKCRRENLTPSLSRLLMGFPEQTIEKLNIYLYRYVKNIEHHQCNRTCQCTECGKDHTFIKQKGDLFKRLKVSGNELGKLYTLHKLLVDEYLIYRQQTSIIPNNLRNIHRNFSMEYFKARIVESIALPESEIQKEIWILQTYIPDFYSLTELLIQSIDSGIKVRILLMWPRSQFAINREQALIHYAGIPSNFSIEEEVLRNLENLAELNYSENKSSNLEIKLYDSSPTISIYRANNYILAGLFMHNNLAINSFQLEIDMNRIDNYMSDDIINEFDTICKMSRDFSLQLRNPNWRNDLRVLF
jgi:hypothetical protein